MAGVESEEDHSGSGGDESELDVDEERSEESEESSADEANGFLDMEAQESGDDDDGDDDDESESGYIEETFPQFCRLPIELRHRVWDFFDPDMRSPARVFKCSVDFNGRRMGFQPGAMLEAQSASARAILGTHQESRVLARRFYPDIVELAGGVVNIPCHKGRDMLLAEGTWMETSEYIKDLLPSLQGFKQFAINTEWDRSDQSADEGVEAVLATFPLGLFPDLETIYFHTQSANFESQELAWCVQDVTQQCYLKSTEELGHSTVDVEWIWCWPKLEYGTLSTSYLNHGRDSETAQEGLGPRVLSTTNGRNAYQLVEFEFKQEINRFDRVKAAVLAGSFEDYKSSSGDDSDLESENEYESEGIDDDTIDEDSEEGESNDDLVVQHSSPHGQASSFGGFSPLEMEAQDERGDGLGETGFSSPEVDLTNVDQESASDSDGVPARTRHRGRRVLADSEDEATEDEVSPPASRTNRPTRTITSESEGDEENPPDVKARSKSKKKRPVLSDSEDEDVHTSSLNRGKSKRPQVLEESESDESDENESEESSEEPSGESSEEDEQPKQLSLVERIGAFRTEVPAGEAESSSDTEYDEFNDEAGEDGADCGRDNYGRSGYDAFQDDDEGEEEYDQEDILETGEDREDDGEDEW